MRILLIFAIGSLFGEPSQDLLTEYRFHCSQRSDIYQHIPTLSSLASQCRSVVEIGVRDVVSTWGIFHGLASSPQQPTQYLGIDLYPPSANKLKRLQTIAKKNQIDFLFWAKNDMTIDIPKCDLLFIDSLHTYCHLTYELEKFHAKAQKYIALHDTSAPWGKRDDWEYRGNYSEYPSWINRQKKGLWSAVEDFLARHPEWHIQKRYINCHGLTILAK